MKLYIVRHDECAGNTRPVLYGQTDYPLTEKGRLQAKALSLRLQDLPIERVICSPLARTQETAALATDHRLKSETDDRLLEQFMGDWEGRSVAEIEAACPDLYQAMLTDWTRDTAVPPHGESFSALKARVSLFLQDILPVEINTLIVSHAGTIAAMMVCLLQKENDYALTLSIPPASLTVIDITDGQAKLE